mmetsp:Transcript_17700/g.57937  ORF Transcript_17700/g.57937 Transcript_17700/m.57937 type:complete len:264 (-) Transcript_17700:122-913(-)
MSSHHAAAWPRSSTATSMRWSGEASTRPCTLWVWATVRPSTALRARSSRARPRRLAPRAGGRRPAAPSIPAPPRSVPSAADGTLPAAPCVVFLLRRESASVTQRWRCAGPPRAEWPNLAAASPPPGLPCAGPEAPRRQSTRGAGTGHSHPGRSQPAPPQPAPRDPGPALYPAMHSALHPCLNPALNSACLYPALNSALNSCLARASCRGPAVSSWGGPRRQAAPGRLGSPPAAATASGRPLATGASRRPSSPATRTTAATKGA